MEREQSRKLKNSIVYIIGAIITGFISFLNAPILTRCLSTEVYVQYSLFISFISAVITISYLGYDSSYLRFYYKNDGFNFVLKCIKYPLLFWILISICIILFRTSFLITLLGAELSILECLFVCLYLLIRIIARFTIITMRMEGFAWNYVIGDSGSALVFILGILFVKMISGYVSFLSIVICFIIDFIFEILLNLIKFPNSNRAFSVKNTVSTTNKELFKFGVFIGISSGIMLFIPLIQKVVVRLLLDTDSVAIYYATSIFATAISLISVSINNIWEPTVYKATNEGKNIKPSFHKYGIFLSWFLLTVLGGVIALRRVLILVLAKQYYSAYIIAPCVTFSACMVIIYQFYSVGIEIEKKTWIRSIIPVVDVAVSVGLLYPLSRMLSIQGVALAILIGSLGSKLIGIHTGLSFYSTGESMAFPIICWLFSLIASLVSLFSISFVSDLIVGIGIIVVGYCICHRKINEIIRNIYIEKVQRRRSKT